MTFTTVPDLEEINTAKTELATRKRGVSTNAVHGGVKRSKACHSLHTPIVQTATYTFEKTQDVIDYMDAHKLGKVQDREEYGRYGNPTISATEKKLAALDSGTDAVLYSSGMCAITSFLLTKLESGAHIVMTHECYRRTRQFAQTWLKRLGIETAVVPMGDYDAMEKAIIPHKTRFIISESPTNPYLRICDLERFADIGQRYQVQTMIDSTFATPVNQRPLEFGIDFVIHSATKYLCGHNDLLAGVVVGKNAEQMKALRDGRGILGGIVDPHSAYLLDRGMKTLGIRVRQQNRTAQAVAEFLDNHPKIECVWYPGLDSHPDCAIARSQMVGFGGVVSFEVTGDLMKTAKFVDACKIPYIAPSLGGVEALIEQPAIVSYWEKTTEERLALGIKDNLVRFAVGVEDTDDILTDIAQALDAL